MKKAVVLLSGGMDSAVTLNIARKKGYKTYCLIFDYGQRHKKETAFAKKIARAANSEYFTLDIKLPWKKSALLDKTVSLPKNRNLSSRKIKIPLSLIISYGIIIFSYPYILW